MFAAQYTAPRQTLAYDEVSLLPSCSGVVIDRHCASDGVHAERCGRHTCTTCSTQQVSKTIACVQNRVAKRATRVPSHARNPPGKSLRVVPAIAMPAPLPRAAITTFGSVGFASATDNRALPVKLKRQDPRNSAHRAMMYLDFVKCSACVCKRPGILARRDHGKL